MKIIFFANTDWYLYNFRRSLALAAQEAGYEVLLVSPDGEYGQKFRELGLRWLPLRMDRRSLNPLRELGVLWWLWRLFRRERPTLVHTFTVKCVIYGGVVARLLRAPARVNAVAGMGFVFSSDSLRARLLRPAVRALLGFSLGGNRARLILQNPDDGDVLRDAHAVDSTHVRLIRGSGVDIKRFACPETRPSDHGGSVRVLLAARLLWDKGIGEYADAARALHEQGLDVRFLLAGSPDAGNPAAVPEDTIKAWVDEGIIEWLGHVDDMAALFQSVDVLVLPSYYGEGLPKSLIEAAACGLPLVTCDTPGCREVVTDEVDGLLVPPRDGPALANAIQRLAESRELRKRLGDAARAKTRAEFDERIVIEKTLAVYGELLQITRSDSIDFLDRFEDSR